MDYYTHGRKQSLVALGLYKRAGVFRMPTAAQPNPSEIGRLENLLKDVTSSRMPKSFGGEAGSHSGMYSKVEQPSVSSSFDPRKRLAGTPIPSELPAIAYLPTKIGSLYDPFFTAQEKAMQAASRNKNLWAQLAPEMRAGLLSGAGHGAAGGVLGYAATDPGAELEPWQGALLSAGLAAPMGGAAGYAMRKHYGRPLDTLATDLKHITRKLRVRSPEAEVFIESLKKDMPGISDKKIRARTHPDVTQHDPRLNPEFMRKMFAETAPLPRELTDKERTLLALRKKVEEAQQSTFVRDARGLGKEYDDAIRRD